MSKVRVRVELTYEYSTDTERYPHGTGGDALEVAKYDLAHNAGIVASSDPKIQSAIFVRDPDMVCPE